MPTRLVPRALAEAATVHAAHREVMTALGSMAASPLDELVVDQMRGAIDRVRSDEVRAAVRRMGPRSAAAAPLRVVARRPPDDPADARSGSVQGLVPIGGAA